MISGSMCFSRLICSIVWYSRLAIPVSPRSHPLQLHH
jgi:hypothetical protein